MSDSVRPHRRQPTRLPCSWDSPGKNTGLGCRFLLQCMKVKRESEVAQSDSSGSHGLQPSRQEYWSGVPLPSPIIRLWQSSFIQQVFMECLLYTRLHDWRWQFRNEQNAVCPQGEYKSPTHQPSSCKILKMQTCFCMSNHGSHK